MSIKFPLDAYHTMEIIEKEKTIVLSIEDTAYESNKQTFEFDQKTSLIVGNILSEWGKQQSKRW